MTAADRIVEALHFANVPVVFGLPGVHNLAIWRALGTASTRLIGVRHEQAAVYAADGFARATGRPGVALVTSGPGAANGVAATGEAQASGSPVVVIASDVPRSLRRPSIVRGILHESRDQAALFAPLVKDTFEPRTPDEVAPAVSSALAVAQAPPAGPVYVGVATDLLDRDANGWTPNPGPSLPHPGEAEFEAASVALLGSRRCLIWAGGGALWAEAGDAIGELAERLAAPVITTYGARGLLGSDHPLLVDAPPHVPEVGALWDEADAVVLVGSDFDGMMTQNWRLPVPEVTVAINVDPEDAVKNLDVSHLLVGDARRATAELAERLPTPPTQVVAAATEKIAQVNRAARASIEADEPQAPVLLDALAEALPAEGVMVADMCIPGYWAGGFARISRPRALSYPVGWGTLGFAFPAAIGPAAAGLSTIALCGDGGFLFACGELATVAQEGLPLVAIVVDDHGYGMLRFDQERAGDPPTGTTLQGPDFAALGATFGIEAETLAGFDDRFAERLSSALQSKRPHLLCVRAALKPPVTTSPRWYRASPGATRDNTTSSTRRIRA